MAAFDVCVDKKGRVTSHKLAPDITSKELDAVIKTTMRAWTFDGRDCSKGPDGKLPVEPWILGPW